MSAKQGVVIRCCRYDAKKPDEEHLMDDQDESKQHVEEDGVFGFMTLVCSSLSSKPGQHALAARI